MRYGYKFKSSGVWVEAAATYSTEAEAETAGQSLGFPYATFTVYQCTCDCGGREIGPWHREACNIYTPF